MQGRATKKTRASKRRAAFFEGQSTEGTHTPVLLQEVLAALEPKDLETFVDATFGGGGYTQALLDACNCFVLAIDRDKETLPRANNVFERYGSRFRFLLSSFGRIKFLLKDVAFQGIVFDFGTSFFQLETAERGFSFQKDGPLDMRMSQEGISAFDVVNTFLQEDLKKIIQTYGEERFSEKISHAIVKERTKNPLRTTLELAQVVRSIVPKSGPLDPATKTFQALRIFVNNELREIEQALMGIGELFLEQQPPILDKITVVTVAFHALEDRIVKNWTRTMEAQALLDGSFQVYKKNAKVRTPSLQEIQDNPRSRSARLRAVVLEKGSEKNPQKSRAPQSPRPQSLRKDS